MRVGVVRAAHGCLCTVCRAVAVRVAIVCRRYGRFLARAQGLTKLSARGHDMTARRRTGPCFIYRLTVMASSVWKYISCISLTGCTCVAFMYVLSPNDFRVPRTRT